jgi:DNA-binding transcriptional ArsR family regulator
VSQCRLPHTRGGSSRKKTAVTEECDAGHSIGLEHIRIFACMKQTVISSNRKVIENVAQRFKVLGQPQRLRILRMLETGPKTVGELVAALGVRQPNVSRHLQALFDAGLVARRRQGNSVTCSVADPMVLRLCELVCADVVEQARAEMAEITMAGSDQPPKRSR